MCWKEIFWFYTLFFSHLIPSTIISLLFHEWSEVFLFDFFYMHVIYGGEMSELKADFIFKLLLLLRAVRSVLVALWAGIRILFATFLPSQRHSDNGLSWERADCREEIEKKRDMAWLKYGERERKERREKKAIAKGWYCFYWTTKQQNKESLKCYGPGARNAIKRLFLCDWSMWTSSS